MKRFIDMEITKDEWMTEIEKLKEEFGRESTEMSNDQFKVTHEARKPPKVLSWSNISAFWIKCGWRDVPPSTLKNRYYSECRKRNIEIFQKG